jgi:hypothetical protein
VGELPLAALQAEAEAREAARLGAGNGGGRPLTVSTMDNLDASELAVSTTAGAQRVGAQFCSSALVHWLWIALCRPKPDPSLAFSSRYGRPDHPPAPSLTHRP